MGALLLDGTVLLSQIRFLNADAITDDSLGKLAVKRKTRDSQESDMVADILGATGVRYRHRNSDVVATSRIAGKAAEDASKVYYTRYFPICLKLTICAAKEKVERSNHWLSRLFAETGAKLAA